MAKKYRNVQLTSIENAPVNPVPHDAHSLWLDLEVLKDFISKIEQEVAAHPETPVRNLGLRFYYSAYPSNKDWHTPGYEDIADLLNDPETLQYEEKHTLIAVPTFEKAGHNQDFNPADAATYTGTAPMPSSTIMALNHGSMIPPKQSIGEWF